MAKAVSLKILKIQYRGDSIGNDILLEIEVVGELFTQGQRIKTGEIFEFNQEVKKLQLNADIFDIPIRIKIIEKDILFSDSGEVKDTLHIDIAKLPQIFNFEVKVQERNKVVSKSTAILLVDFSHSNLRQYKSPKSGHNYNQYDVAIEDTVKYWNNEFFKQTNPLVVPLDPNLVKAIIYVESKMGYYIPSDSYIKKNPNYYRSHPDVMQVGDPRNGSLFVLKNIENPKTGKKSTEFEIIDGKEVKIEYPEANVDTPEQSIFWGVRWLFRKARENIKQVDGTWIRKWLDWKEAIRKYNIGDSGYVEKVYKVYEQGLGERKFKLWQIGGLIILLLGISSFIDYDRLDDPFFYNGSAAVINASERTENYNEWMSINNLRDKVLNSYGEKDRNEIEDIEIYRPYDSQLFVAIIEDEKDWWEYFKIGKVENGKIKWLELKNWPKGEYMENSILSTRWVKLKGFKEPILEVYGTTHMGNGDIYLLKVDNDEYSLIFKTSAVQSVYFRWAPENYKKYGYGTCSESPRGGSFLADYSDINNDGFSDILLNGTIDIVCEKEQANMDGEYPKIKISKYPVEFTYLWDNNSKTWKEK